MKKRVTSIRDTYSTKGTIGRYDWKKAFCICWLCFFIDVQPIRQWGKILLEKEDLCYIANP